MVISVQSNLARLKKYRGILKHVGKMEKILKVLISIVWLVHTQQSPKNNLNQFSTQWLGKKTIKSIKCSQKTSDWIR